MEEANRKRITAKSWLTRATNKLRQLLDSGEFTQISLVAQIEEFEKRLGNLDETQSLVEEHIEIEKLEDDIEAAAQFRAEKLVTLLAAREKQVSTAELDNLSQEKTESSTSERVQPSGQVSRLPKLQLPKFSGEYTEWQTFWDKFRAVIDSNNSIPTVNKFTYLQSLLQGEAAATISGLSLTETNYSTAKTLLQTRFGRPERIIFSHIQRLLQTNLFLTSKPTCGDFTTRSLLRLGASRIWASEERAMGSSSPHSSCISYLTTSGWSGLELTRGRREILVSF